jgi:tetratricopeptide (TPR) repeat protein
MATGALRAAKIVWRHRFEDDRPFRREFEGIQRFEQISREHPSQLALFHIGRNDPEGYFYYVMELADDAGDWHQAAGGRRNEGMARSASTVSTSDLRPSAIERYSPHTLRAELERGRLPASRVLEIGLALAEALSHLHRNGLVHRDVKPSNVIFVKGRPKLADIGLVTDASDQCSIVGTEGYLPPEGPGTSQADIFALGKVLYEAATGMDRRRFPDLPPDLRQWPERETVFELNPIIVKACAGDIRNRYASAGEMLSDLALLQQGKSVRRQFRWRRFLATARRTGLAALTLAATAVAFVVLWRGLGKPYDVSSNPDAKALVEQGFVCVNGETSERQQEAESYFQEALNLDRSFVPALWGLFQVAINKHEWEWYASAEAHQHIRALAERLRKTAPGRAESHIAASFIKWMDWRFAEALVEDRAALRERAASEEGRAVAHNVHGWHLVETGHPDEAQAEYLRAKALYPTSPVVLHHLGNPYFARKQFPEALEYYQKSVRLEPRHILGHRNIIRVYEATGNFLGAIHEYEEISRLNGQDPTTNALFQEFREAVARDPVHGYWAKQLDLALRNPQQNLYGIATFYAQLGDTTNAYAFLRKACEKHAFSQGPLSDPCWDKTDTNFQAIVRGIGLWQ